MKKLLIILLALGSLTLPLLMSTTSHAQLDPFEQICDGSTSDAAVCNTDGSKDPISGEDGIILKVVDILAYVVGAAAVIMIIIGGLKFITANGDPNSVSSARNTVLFTLIGVAVFAIANLIVRFIISKL